MIAIAELAVYLLAKADFSRSDRRKMAGGVLDDGTTAVFASRSLAKALFAFIARISDAKSAALFDLLRVK